jgi:hypothetical protein
MADRVICDVCGDTVAPHAHYVIRMDVFADPSVPPVTGEELEEADHEAKISELIKQMEAMSPDDLQDQVHRRFEFRVCRGCQRGFLANPLGLPRQRRSGEN